MSYDHPQHDHRRAPLLLSPAFVIRVCAALALLCVTAYAQNQTLGPGSCGRGKTNCHNTDFKWWDSDPHSTSVDALYDDLETAEKYAELYGIGAANLFSGTSACMTCHGTVVSGAETQTTDFGVSCESCHGPGSAYLAPHAEGDPAKERARSGYLKALSLGLLELAKMNVRAEACVSCHYVTDTKLLGVGHSNGDRFNYISGTKKVAKHWDRELFENELDKAPFKAFMKAIAPSTMIIASITPAAQTQPQTKIAAPPSPPPPQAPRKRDPVIATAPPKPITLPPFPRVSDSASVRELLFIIARRLELLARKVGDK